MENKTNIIELELVNEDEAISQFIKLILNKIVNRVGDYISLSFEEITETIKFPLLNITWVLLGYRVYYCRLLEAPFTGARIGNGSCTIYLNERLHSQWSTRWNLILNDLEKYLMKKENLRILETQKERA